MTEANIVEVNNLTDFSIKESFLKKITSKVLKEEGRPNSKISLALVGKEEIKKKNKKYLDRNFPTDVLSFSFLNQKDHPAEKEFILGEVVICPKKVKENSQESDISFKKELARVLIHGILHLLGYSHEKSEPEAEKMRQKEKYYLNILKDIKN